MAGIDSFTKLMLHCNGADASTTFTDDSLSPHTVTAVGNTQIDTAQSVFGGASALFDNSGDYLSIPDSDDWAFGTGDFTIDFRVRFNSLATNDCMVSIYDDGGSNRCLFSIGASNSIEFIAQSGGSEIANFKTPASSVTTGVWYHIALVRNGNNEFIFIDGVSQSLTYVTNPDATTNYPNISSICRIGAQVFGWYLDGHMDEIRISKGIARWTSNFTPPSSEYATPNIVDSLDLTATIETPTIIIDSTVIPSPLTVASTIETPSGVGNIVSTSPASLELGATLETPTIIIDSTVTPPELTLTVDIQAPEITGIHGSKFASAVASYNPILFVSDTVPAKITKVDVTIPASPTYTTEVLVGANNAKDIAINETTGFAFVACADGIIVKIELADLSNQTIIDLSDTDETVAIDTLSDFDITAIGTDQSTGEAYLLDGRSTYEMECDFQLIAEKKILIDTDFNVVQTFSMDTDFQLLSEKSFNIDTDFNLITAPLNNIAPIVRDDFHVLINSVELSNTDVDLSSIKIHKSEDIKTKVTFKLCRLHDDLNTIIGGGTSTITNQNDVEIKIQSTTIFTGKISQISPNYNVSSDEVNITAVGSIPTGQYNDVTLSLPGQNEVLNLYHILLQNHTINNEFIDPNETNPTKFKGVRVSLGTQITQKVNRFLELDNLGSIAESIQDGTFNAKQNVTYFWSPTVTKFGDVTIKQNVANVKTAEDPSDTSKTSFEKIGFELPVFTLPTLEFPDLVTIPYPDSNTSAIHFAYIGTSLSPVSSDLWDLNNAKHRKQYVFEDTTLKLGNGSIVASDLSEVVSNPTSVYAELQSRGWLDGSGNITLSFKQTTESDELELSINSCEQSEVYKILELNLGYTIGSAPFNDITSKNGQLITVYKWSDENNGLYSIKDESYNYTEYAKKIAELEYKKLSNINGDILPDTSCNIDVTVDALLYFNLGILTKLNIDNTTSAGIFKNNNGFPVSIKSLTIDTSAMKVTVQADNKKSITELEAIDGEFACEEDQEYIEPLRAILIAPKSDMSTRLAIDDETRHKIKKALR